MKPMTNEQPPYMPPPQPAGDPPTAGGTGIIATLPPAPRPADARGVVMSSRLRGVGFLLAGLGALVALAAFYVLSYATLTLSLASTTDQSGVSSIPGSQNSFMVSLTGAQANSTALSLVPPLLLVGLIFALFPALRNRVDGVLTPRNGAVACIAAGALGGLVLVSQVLTSQSALNQSLGSLSALSPLLKLNTTLTLEPGFWVLAGGLGALLLGGVLALIARVRA